MSFFRRLVGAGRADQASSETGLPPLTFVSDDIVIPAVDFTTHGGGGDSYSRGYMLIGPEGGEYAHLSDVVSSSWAKAGISTRFVAGVTKRAAALASPAFAPGQPVQLVPEPQNQYDRNAIGVWDAAARLQLGYVPHDDAAAIAGRVAEYGAYAIREAIDKATGRRVGVKILLAPNLAATPGESMSG